MSGSGEEDSIARRSCTTGGAGGRGDCARESGIVQDAAWLKKVCLGWRMHLGRFEQREANKDKCLDWLLQHRSMGAGRFFGRDPPASAIAPPGRRGTTRAATRREFS